MARTRRWAATGNDEDMEAGCGSNGYEDKLRGRIVDKSVSCGSDGEEDKVAGDDEDEEASSVRQR